MGIRTLLIVLNEWNKLNLKFYKFWRNVTDLFYRVIAPD